MARISRALLDQVLALAAAEPTEICGLLLGEGEHIHAILPTANVAADPVRHFEIDPAALIAAYRSARSGGPTILGHYHSHPHPTSLDQPSTTDAAAAVPDCSLWLIAAAGRAALWRATGFGLYDLFALEPLHIV
jgi:proteasome lid subunit RPN8/RPN11